MLLAWHGRAQQTAAGQRNGRLTFLARACVAQLHGADPAAVFTSVSIDTRTLQPSALYVALRGASFDGHRFVDQAVAQGATGCW